MTNATALLANDPVWLSLLKAVVILLFLVVSTTLMIWVERRVIGRMQHRPGPNRAGPFGILQSIADALKLGLKEDIRPRLADKWVYFIAPLCSAIPAFVAFSVIPIGPEVSIFGHRTVLQLADLNVGVLVVLASSSVGVYGVLLSGWGSGTPYPLLGALRAAAQVISYEIAMGLSIIGVVLFSHTLSTAGIVAAQQHGWFIYLLPSFVIYLISMVGETNRAPFDLAEAESELVGGFHTEYSGLRFAMFYLAEYINMTTVSAFATTLFLGGWRAPWPLSLWAGANTGWWPVLWFLIKTGLLLFGFIWLRATLPRFRYDQFMRVGWKWLVPISLVWFVVVAAIRALRSSGQYSFGTVLIFVGVLAVIMVVVALLLPDRRLPDDGAGSVPLAGGHPVPPLDLEVPRKQPRATRKAAEPRESAAIGAGPPTDPASTGKERTDGDV